ncbi:MAG: MOSC domain-containing protein [Planctomycetota bacterium]|nr:MAG: MOSC domain-containing protein [Planctomycetota bacterium]
MPKLSDISIYPFKSLDAQRVDEAVVLPSGALEGDRRFALVDVHGDWVNGKRTAEIHRLRSRFDPSNEQLTLRVEGTSEEHTFAVRAERKALTDWLSAFLGIAIDLIENPDAGFPDDSLSPGPTVISTATLAEVAGWFAPMGIEEARLRFRANLEIDVEEAFWEDRLLAGGDGAVRFRIGDVEFLGTNPCARCIVPTRNPQSGEVLHGLSKAFARRRRETLPAWAPADRFDHFYRLTTNTRPAGVSGGTLRVGDEVTILGPA